MTKQEAIEREQELSNLLESMPDDGGIDIMNAEIRDSYGMSHTQIYLRSGIETVGKALGRHIKEEIPDGCVYVHRTITITLCDYVQLDSIDSTGDNPMVQEDAKEELEPEYIVSWDGYDGCQREMRFKTREDAELEAADLREHIIFPESVSVTRWPDEPCRLKCAPPDAQDPAGQESNYNKEALSSIIHLKRAGRKEKIMTITEINFVRNYSKSAVLIKKPFVIILR